VRVGVERAEAVSQALARFDAIAKVETIGTGNGRVQLRAMPREGAPAAPELVALIRTKFIEVDDVSIERGNLDDVFRQITTSDTGASHA
jgi:hypothetical protein